VEHYVNPYKTGGVGHPETMWLWVAGIGLVSTVLMLLYDRFLAPRAAER